MTHKFKKTGQQVTKLGASWKGKNEVDYVNVLVPLGHTSKAGNVADIQVARLDSLVKLEINL